MRKPGGRIPDPNPNAAPGATIPTPAFTYGAKSQKRWTVACDLVRYYQTVGRDLTAANIQWNQVMSNFEVQWKALKDRKDEDDPDVPTITKALPIIKWTETDRIPSTTPGAEPPRDARESGSARSHSTHLETSSSDRPKWSPTRSSTRNQDQISVTSMRRTLRLPSFTRAVHAQPSLSNFPRRDSNFGERTHSRGTTLGERNFPTSPQNKKTKLTHCSIYVPMRTISTPQTK